jgi:hypothetical protein
MKSKCDFEVPPKSPSLSDLTVEHAQRICIAGAMREGRVCEHQ